MSNKITNLFNQLLLAAAILPSAQLQAAIFDYDSRQDLYEVKDADVLQLAQSTVAIFNDDWISSYIKMPKIKLDPSGDWLIGGHFLKDFDSIDPKSHKLCSGERYLHQYSDSHCSGALIGPDIVLTAGHCITDADACKDARLVFGYDASSSTDPGKSRFPAKDVYRCKAVIHAATPKMFEKRTTDFSIVRLDRIVTDRAPLAVDLNPQYQEGNELFTIGHPEGTPTKYSEGKVLWVEPTTSEIPPMLHTTITAFPGNSGGPVFDRKSLKIVGIIEGGSPDFALDEQNSCLKSTVYSSNVAKGSLGTPQRYNLVTRTTVMDFSGISLH